MASPSAAFVAATVEKCDFLERRGERCYAFVFLVYQVSSVSFLQCLTSLYFLRIFYVHPPLHPSTAIGASLKTNT